MFQRLINRKLVGEKKFPSVEGTCTLVQVSELCKEDEEFVRFLLKNKESIRLECICSGYGSSAFEPDVPNYKEVLESLVLLIEQGFPISRIIVKISPLICNDKGITQAQRVVNAIRGSGIYRLKISKLFQTNGQILAMRRRFGNVIKQNNVEQRIAKFLEENSDFIIEYCKEEQYECTDCFRPDLIEASSGMIYTTKFEYCKSIKYCKELVCGAECKLPYYRR